MSHSRPPACSHAFLALRHESFPFPLSLTHCLSMTLRGRPVREQASGMGGPLWSEGSIERGIDRNGVNDEPHSSEGVCARAALGRGYNSTLHPASFRACNPALSLVVLSSPCGFPSEFRSSTAAHCYSLLLTTYYAHLTPRSRTTSLPTPAATANTSIPSIPARHSVCITPRLRSAVCF